MGLTRNRPDPNTSTADQRLADLKEVLRKILDIVPRPKLLALAERANHELPLKENGLTNFVDTVSDPAARSAFALEEFLYHSSIGRALVRLTLETDSYSDEIEELLTGGIRMPEMAASGRGRQPPPTLEGHYLVYHHSYIKDAGNVIRHFEITRDGYGILNVRDTCRDFGMGDSRINIAIGRVIVIGQRLQMLLVSREPDRRVGFSLVLATDVRQENHKVVSFEGALSGMNEEWKPFDRRYRAVRYELNDRRITAKNVDEMRKKLIDRTGRFESKDLEKWNRDEFERLAGKIS